MPTIKASTSRSHASKSVGRGSGRTSSKSSLAFTSSPQASKLPFVRSAVSVTDPRPRSQKRVKLEPHLSSHKGKSRATDKETISRSSSDDWLWSVRFAPRNRSELSVHPRKVSDVERWLSEALNGARSLQRLRRLLILSGPAGSGKTQTLRQLSAKEELDFEIVEYKSEVNQTAASSEYPEPLGVAASFRDFLSKAARFRTLHFTSQDAQASCSSSQANYESGGRRLIVLEDLPTLSHAPTLQAFQEALTTFLHQDIDASNGNVPVCVILSHASSASERGLGHDWGSERNDAREMDWMRPRKLLGDVASRHNAWTEIKFNAVAATFVKKALKAVVDKAQQGDQEVKMESKKPSQFPMEVADAIAEDSPGDVRSAVDMLQQVYNVWTREPQRFWEVIDRKTKGSAKDHAHQVLSDLGMVNREATLDLFHALGKLLYNKRIVSSDSGDRLQASEQSMDIGPLGNLPLHLSHLERPESAVEIESLTSSRVEPSVLELFAHHNYTQFCQDMEQCENIAEAYSFADSCFRFNHFDQFSSQSAVHQYSFLVTAHTSLVHLPYTSAAGQGTASKTRSQQRLTKPSFFDAHVDLNANQAILREIKETRNADGLVTTTGGRAPWILGSNQEVAEEWVPLLSKIHTRWSSSADESPISRLGRIDASNSFSANLVRFAPLDGSEDGWPLFDTEPQSQPTEEQSLPLVDEESRHEDAAKLGSARDDVVAMNFQFDDEGESNASVNEDTAEVSSEDDIEDFNE